MNSQVGQSVLAGGDAAGRAAGQPDKVAIGKRLVAVRSTHDTTTRDDDEHDVEIRLGMGAHALPGREMDEVRVELPARLGQRPPRTGRYARIVADELAQVGQDPRRRLLRREISGTSRLGGPLVRHQLLPGRSGLAIPRARPPDSPS